MKEIENQSKEQKKYKKKYGKKNKEKKNNLGSIDGKTEDQMLNQ